jgi:hypothetical protein
MKEINAKITLDEESLNSIIENIDDVLVDRIKEELSVETDYDDQISDWADRNLDDKIEEWFNDNIDIDDKINDYMQDFNIRDYQDDLDLDSYIDGESIARNLLGQYSPTNNCSTSQAFTEAVLDALRYLLLQDDNVAYVVRAIERYNRHQIKKEFEEQIKLQTIEQLRESIEAETRAKHFDEFAKQVANVALNDNGINPNHEPNKPNVNYGY